MVWDGFHHQTGPNSGLCSENGRALYIKHFRNIEIPALMNMATGDIETLQSPSFKNQPGETRDLRRRTEKTPAKDSHTRIKPLALAFGQRPRPLHDRCTRCVRWGMAVAVYCTYSRYKFVTVSLPKRFRDGRFTSETAVRRFQK
jgi:hypothetical protein